MSIFSKSLRASGISLDDQVGFLYTGSDPTTGSGFEAPIGSILIWKYTPPKVYQKTGSGNTDWTALQYTSALPSGYEAAESTRLIKYVSATSISVAGTNIKISGYNISSISATLSITSDLLSGETEQASKWYGIWLFYNPTTSSYVLKLSSNLTSPTMPSGYTLAKLISAVRNNSSSNFLSFTHDNEMYKITEASLVIYNAVPSNVSPGTTLDISPYVCENIFDQILNLTIRISKGEVDFYTQQQDSNYLLEANVANANNNTQYTQLSLFGTKPSLRMLRVGALTSFQVSLVSWRVKEI